MQIRIQNKAGYDQEFEVHGWNNNKTITVKAHSTAAINAPDGKSRLNISSIDERNALIRRQELPVLLSLFTKATKASRQKSRRRALEVRSFVNHSYRASSPLFDISRRLLNKATNILLSEI